MFGRTSIAFLFVWLLAMPVAAQTVGQKVSGSLHLKSNVQSKLYAALPKGVWQIIAMGQRRSSVSNVKLIKIFLAQLRGKKLFGLIRIGFNIEVPNSHRALPRECTRENVFYRFPDASTFINPRRGFDCFNIGHIAMTTGKNPSQSAKDTHRWIRENTTGMPGIMIRADFHRSDSSQHLRIRYFRNPEAEGFAPAVDTGWRSSNWHYDRLHRDPKRLAYVTKIKDWAIAWKPRFEAGFLGQGFKAAPITKSTPANEAPKTTGSDAEVKLKKLQHLLDKKLITPDEYRDQRKKILDSL